MIPHDKSHREGRNYGSSKEGPLAVGWGARSPDASRTAAHDPRGNACLGWVEGGLDEAWWELEC